MIMNVKSFRKRHLCGISINIFKKNKLIFMKKLYCTQQLGCTAKLDKFYVIYLVLTKEMAQK